MKEASIAAVRIRGTCAHDRIVSVSRTVLIAASAQAGGLFPRQSHLFFRVHLAGVLAPLLGRIGLGIHLESACAASIVPSGRW